MSFVLRVLGMSDSIPARDPWDDRWYGLGSSMSVAGVAVDAETALKISTVFACVGLLAETIGALPLVVYQRMGEDSRERARNHPLYFLLHDRPNERMTAFEFVRVMTADCLLRGNGYAEIRPGRRGPVDQLLRIHPDKVRPEELPNGRVRYLVQQRNGSWKPFNEEDIFHLRGLSWDGLKGVSVVDYARDQFGSTLAAAQYGGRFWRNDSSPGGVLTTEKKLSPGAKTRLKAQWEAAHSGGNQHRVAVLEEGLAWQQVGISPEEAQFLETRVFDAEEVCRWFRVPPHMVGLTSKATSWGSGIEQMGIGFVTYTLLPWLTLWRQSIGRDLILAEDRFFADFVLGGLLRGDTVSRNQAYATGRQWGWWSANDVRRMENENPIEGGDVYLRPMNMVDAGWEGPPRTEGPPESLTQRREDAKGSGEWAVNSGQLGGHYWGLAVEGAGRLVRKELAAMERLAGRVAVGSAAWEEGVAAFYGEHIGLVARTMRMDVGLAERYCAEQGEALIAEGPGVMVDWEWRRVRELAGMAVGAGEIWVDTAVMVNGHGNNEL